MADRVLTSAVNVYLLTAARASLVGADIGLEYRYQTECALLFVLAAGLAFLPLVGAPVRNEVREDVPRTYETPALRRGGRRRRGGALGGLVGALRQPVAGPQPH